mmetsp:Transcript_42756/g.107909  ORF Transcript_42756/g.107909 Transcript_42756/m.107909 type:complete len:282 (+) Transcript_42756:1298-2143(+)
MLLGAGRDAGVAGTGYHAAQLVQDLVRREHLEAAAGRLGQRTEHIEGEQLVTEQDHHMSGVLVDAQLILGLAGYAALAKHARELVHAQRALGHLLGGHLATGQRLLKAHRVPGGQRRGRLAIAAAQQRLCAEQRCVVVHVHRIRVARTQIGQLLPPLLQPVARLGRTLRQPRLQLLAKAARLAEVLHQRRKLLIAAARDRRCQHLITSGGAAATAAAAGRCTSRVVEEGPHRAQKQVTGFVQRRQWQWWESVLCCEHITGRRWWRRCSWCRRHHERVRVVR